MISESMIEAIDAQHRRRHVEMQGLVIGFGQLMAAMSRLPKKSDRKRAWHPPVVEEMTRQQRRCAMRRTAR